MTFQEDCVDRGGRTCSTSRRSHNIFSEVKDTRTLYAHRSDIVSLVPTPPEVDLDPNPPDRSRMEQAIPINS
jgi:hypothetical protein